MKCVCNRKCFNCIHPDCILEDERVTVDEIRESDSRDKQILRERILEPDEARKKREYQYKKTAETYLKNAEKYRAKAKEYQRTHREKRRAYYLANRERIISQKKEYDQANKNRVNEQARKRYHAKKVLDNEPSSCENH